MDVFVAPSSLALLSFLSILLGYSTPAQAASTWQEFAVPQQRLQIPVRGFSRAPLYNLPAKTYRYRIERLQNGASSVTIRYDQHDHWLTMANGDLPSDTVSEQYKRNPILLHYSDIRQGGRYEVTLKSDSIEGFSKIYVMEWRALKIVLDFIQQHEGSLALALRNAPESASFLTTSDPVPILDKLFLEEQLFEFVPEPVPNLPSDEYKLHLTDCTQSTCGIEANRPLLLVTHMSRSFVKPEVVLPYVSDLIKNSRNENFVIGFLSERTDGSRYLLDGATADFSIFSQSGSHQLHVDSDNVTVIGGFFSECHLDTLRDVVFQFFTRNLHQQVLTLHIPLRGTFEGGSFSAAQYLRAGISEFGKGYFDRNILSQLFGFPSALTGPLFFNRSHSSDRSLKELKVDTNSYRFRIFLDGEFRFELGTAPQVVNIFFE